MYLSSQHLGELGSFRISDQLGLQCKTLLLKKEQCVQAENFLRDQRVQTAISKRTQEIHIRLLHLGNILRAMNWRRGFNVIYHGHSACCNKHTTLVFKKKIL